MKDYYIVNTEDLLHIGTKKHSGRYPYGSGKRPYQREKKDGYFQRIKQRKTEKQLREKIQREKEAAEEKRRHDADKERVLRAGTATEVLKYQGELTQKQLEAAYNRIDWENKLRNISAKEIQTNMQKIDRAMDDIKTVTNWTKTAIEAYNTLAKIYNATDAGKENPWPLVTGGGDQQKKK